MHSLAVRIVSLISLFLVTFIAGILPLKLRRKRQLSDEDRSTLQDKRRTRLLSLCSCFAGGVFFATTMINLIPLVEEEFKAVFDHAGISTDFPVATFAISVGFFFILILEQITLVVQERPSCDHGGKAITSPLLGNGQARSYGTKTSDIHELESNSFNTEQNANENQPSSAAPNNRLDRLEYIQSIANVLSNEHEHDHNIFADISKNHQTKRHLRSYLLLMALTIHALFEGLAVGLFKNIDDMVEVLAALIIHKCTLGFSIGINLVQHSFPSSMVARSSFLFSAVSPVGFGIGILLLTYSSSNLGRIFSSVFQAIATGTCLYVTFFEIFFHELNSKECHKLLKVLMIILGYSLPAIVAYFE